MAKDKQFNYKNATKRTHYINNEIWEDAMLLLRIKGISQAEYINLLIQEDVKKNYGKIRQLKDLMNKLKKIENKEADNNFDYIKILKNKAKRSEE